MWRHRFNGVLGLWVVALAFLGFSESLKRILLVVTGILVAVVAFGGHQLIKPAKDLEKKEETPTP